MFASWNRTPPTILWEMKLAAGAAPVGLQPTWKKLCWCGWHSYINTNPVKPDAKAKDLTLLNKTHKHLSAKAMKRRKVVSSFAVFVLSVTHHYATQEKWWPCPTNHSFIQKQETRTLLLLHCLTKWRHVKKQDLVKLADDEQEETLCQLLNANVKPSLSLAMRSQWEWSSSKINMLLSRLVIVLFIFDFTIQCIGIAELAKTIYFIVKHTNTIYCYCWRSLCNTLHQYDGAQLLIFYMLMCSIPYTIQY